ncbi:hypothetical protein PhaeoP23_03961 (plasmid) [Phaeobacter piscinae]|uniref:Uncharacterized protein n=1 Tax=Phaeobacter piscinae TaxID=1580596 RepID=A0ABN5DP64_9RHOB|nr:MULTISPECIES: hypothetical protein [Phaeobacter]ATG38114.1 hypothetical protein PhaeoP36_04039 [Phaeobacter piscinae]AUQ88635.1 hypothetical protein PhaeoP42_04040 [Phaeobacter piscinae]AUQ92634.1 hypothetical protein PhaeoP24_04076 [Phaeobacter inhibens]AUR26440.1 hypothetical protein PhaeoP23_03961 [Phaeobacter piscinae]
MTTAGNARLLILARPISGPGPFHADLFHSVIDAYGAHGATGDLNEAEGFG